MKWNFDNDRPIYSQIIDQVKLFIISGQLPLGSKFPSVRELAADAKVNPNTVQRALSELENTGLIYSNRTTGRFVTEDEITINSIKEEIAQKSIKEFLFNMNKIGYDKDTAIKLLQEYKGDEINE